MIIIYSNTEIVSGTFKPISGWDGGSGWKHIVTKSPYNDDILESPDINR